MFEAPAHLDATADAAGMTHEEAVEEVEVALKEWNEVETNVIGFPRVICRSEG